MAKLIGIAVKPQKLQPMQVLSAGELSITGGVAGDCRGQPGPRQVTLLSQSSWQTACAEIGVDLPWEARRANLLVDDLPLHQSIGTHIVLGDAVLEITGETDPCERMEAVHPGLRTALSHNWRGGVCCRVLQGGPLAMGMPVRLAPGQTIPFNNKQQLWNIDMKYFFRIFFRTLRTVLGPVVLLWEKLTTPKGIGRPAQAQQQVDQQCRSLALYQFKTCPFCIKVRREIKRLSLNIELRDAQNNEQNRAALLQGGGKAQTPCLRITDEQGNSQWLYESADIIQYMHTRFS